MSDEKLDLLRKIKALADEGATPGERAAASAKLRLLMGKFGVTEDQLADDEEEFHIIRIRLKGAAERALAVQVLGVVINKTKISFRYKRGLLGYWSTKLQAMEYEFLLPYYIKAYRKQQEDFARMFIQANHLFPDTEDDGERPTLTPEEIAKLMKILQGAQALDKVPTPHKQLKA